jgi:hypothetical protein
MRETIVNQNIIRPTLGALFLGLLIAQTPFSAAKAQSIPETMIDLFLRSNAPIPSIDSKTQQLYLSMRNWLGPYQGVRKVGNEYLATFKYALLPVVVQLNGRGQIQAIGTGCPRSESLSLRQAPNNLRQAWSKCTSLKP